jgi:hypothetical protein
VTVRSVGLWLLALLITLGSAAYQRLTGPTHPIRGEVDLAGATVALKLTRSHGGEGDQPLRVEAPDPEIGGLVVWRRYPTSDPWRVIPFRREGSALVAALPHQPPAGKLEYQLRLERGAARAVFPPWPAITRFKGAVSPFVLVPHVVAMFAGMLLSTRAGLEALFRDGAPRRYALVALVLIAAGGLFLGPLVQKSAFDAYWTGWPFGEDLTDNKTAAAALVWAIALWRLRGGRSARVAVVLAAVVTFVVFVIPHSAWGSEIRWDDLPAATGTAPQS